MKKNSFPGQDSSGRVGLKTLDQVKPQGGLTGDTGRGRMKPIKPIKSKDIEKNKGSQGQSVPLYNRAIQRIKGIRMPRFATRAGLIWNPKFLQPVLAGIICTALLSGAYFYPKVNAADVVEDLGVEKAYSVSLKGQEIGILGDTKSVENVMESIRSEYRGLFGMEVSLDQEPEFTEVYVEKKHLSSMEDIKAIIENNVSARVHAFALQVNGKSEAVLRSEEQAQELLAEIQEPYRKAAEEAGSTLDEITFEEQIQVLPTLVDYGQVECTAEALQKLTVGVDAIQVYTVEEGDNLWSIGDQYGLTEEEIIQANPFLNGSDLIHPGDELNLTLPEKLIHVVTVETSKYNDPIPFSTETRSDNSLYKGQMKTIRKGTTGTKEVVAKIYKYDGIEREREILSEKVISEPTAQIVAKGTRSQPKYSEVTSQGDGLLIWPTKGTITSTVGSRWGRFHAGLDIANSVGTPVYAARSGTVSYAGWASGYGKLIKISHNGGMISYYGHLNAWKVSSGQYVKQGQLIGYMGNTGRSTGPHLHFEVRINGDVINPLKYLD